MEQTLLIALAATFIAVACGVGFVGLGITQALQRREQQWVLTRATSDGTMEAILRFIRLTMLEMFLPLPSVQNLLRTSRKNLLRAGDGTDPEEFVGALMVQGLIGGLVLAVLASLLLSPASGLLIGAAGGTLWSIWIRPALLDADASNRSRAIYRRIPYALDLCVLVLETGGTLREGLEEIAQQDDPLAEELRITLLEMDSGATQSKALRSMGERVGLESLETILTAINRGEETGAPMVNTLITQADTFRERRLQEIEKLAVEAPTKMTFPNMMIMVSVLLLIVGPLLIQLVSSGLF
jgi:Flp pilus assembly protein TadB